MPEEEIKASSQSAAGAESSKSKKKKNKKRKQTPQPGDPDYKTPTQLRNARKRRKKKQDKENSNVSSSSKSETSVSLPYGSINDPSLKYLSNPKAAPTVRNAIKFFREKTNAQAGTNHDQYFPVICGPKLGWRTVARLAVKNNHQKLRIGLFVPGSHELLPVPDCPVHHRKINGLVKVLEETCNSLGVQAMGEDDSNNDSFGLRYIAIAVERTTKRQQLVLVWKEPSQTNDKNNELIDDLIQQLVKLSRDKTNQDIRLQSVWIHYNNTWKHSNSIFDRQGRWETKFVDDQKNDNDKDDPLYGSIRECMLPLAPKKNKDGKVIAVTTSALEKIHVPLFFPPQVFRQANLDGFAKIILRIREWLHEQQLKEPALPAPSDTQNLGVEEGQQAPKRKRRRGKRDTSNNKEENVNDPKISPTTTTNTGSLKSLGHCLELYGGVGTIGLNLVDYFDSLDSSDENPFNEICFHASADQMKVVTNDCKTLLDPSKRSKITYTSKSASDICVEQYESLKKARVVVVDPPRKGLDAPVVEALCSDYGESNELAQHLVYVSCGFDAFRRDYRALVEHSGKWTLNNAEGHILFPGSDAIETLAFFTRTKE
mmetsp:Transcript_7325/g.17899  ORF Transcript_7325/g.17899 Transcript_7325/m.17899 type:complete len:598 (-) Transcript_7325:1663-3456(-)